MNVRTLTRGLTLGLALWGSLTLAGPLYSQSSSAPPLRPRVEIAVDSSRASVSSVDILSDGHTHELLQNGFPARLHFRTELWTSGGLFNHLVGGAEWDIVVRYDPLEKKFRAARLMNNKVTVLGDFDGYTSLTSALSTPFGLPLAPAKRGRYYYLTTLDMEMLSLSDLDEVERWLRGELGPAVRGQRNPGTAVGNGLRTFFLRLIGGERRHYEARSGTFRVP